MIPPARPGFSGSQAALSGSGASARGLPSVAFFHSTRKCFLLELSPGLAQWKLSSDPLHCQGRQPLHACIQRSCSHCIDGVLHCPRHVQGPVANWPACMAAMHGLLRYSGITLLAPLYSMVLACAEESEIGRAKRPASSHCVLGPEQAAWLSAYSRLGMTIGRWWPAAGSRICSVQQLPDSRQCAAAEYYELSSRSPIRKAACVQVLVGAGAANQRSSPL